MLGTYVPSKFLIRNTKTKGPSFRVFVVALPPGTRLVAPLGRAIEPLIHSPQSVEAARVSGIGVVDNFVFECECADARPLAQVCGHIGSAHGCMVLHRLDAILLNQARLKHLPPPVVVFDAFLALLLLGEPDAEIEVEVAA